MAKASAGLLMYRKRGSDIEVLIAHMGGPFFAKKDDGFWSIPKGEVKDGESPLAAAIREFAEETGLAHTEPLAHLGSVVHSSGKEVHAWAFEGDCDPALIASNTFTLEWPPKSGRFAEFPENDKTEFFTVRDAKRKLIYHQAELIDRLEEHLATHTS